jgi:hypothetical protein
MDRVESQAAGTAVIAFAGGSAAETVRGLDTEAPTDVLFGTQTTSAMVSALARYDAQAQRIAAATCGRDAARFALRASLARVSSSRP